MNDHTYLWYKAPADDWNKALPLGNGRIGAMVFSQPIDERIQLNEDSIWSGGYRERNNPNAYENLEKVRQLLFDEKISEAEEIVNDLFCGTPVNQRHYMPLGDLSVRHYKEDTADFHKRYLDLENAVNVTEYALSGREYRREVFISYPDQVMAVNIRCDSAKSISVRIGIDGRDDYFDDNTPVSDNEILFYGGCGGRDGIGFAAFIKVLNKGGAVRRHGSFIETEDCDEVTILLGAQTSYRAEDFKGQARFDVDEAAKLSFSDLKARHIADYKRFYDRAEILLDDRENENEISELATDERLERVKNGKADNKLAVLYHNFGRYLYIAGSREDTLPMNLQGIWNKDMWPAWGCKFTININTEMNYWAAESCNLSEMHTPLFDHIEKMREHGRETAKKMYNCRGFVCHHNTDIWGDTAPQDLWMPATQWPMGAAWLCLHIWEHYRFTLDKEFLESKYDTLREAALFFVDFLIEDKQGRLVTCPSVSPENTYITESGTKGSLCIGPSMDSQIINCLFGAVIDAGKILGIDSQFGKELEKLRDRLPKPEIGKYGQIKEWAIDYDEAEPGHRHVSQLFALYPAELISKRKTPELAKAAEATLERRLSHGGGHTGWSRAWMINFYARLFEGEKVYQNIDALFKNSTADNMFDMHPPFQIDGNFGAAAGITEALLQSENGEIIVLPALPEKWESGSFRGLKARGGYTVSCKWSGGKANEIEISAAHDGKCRLVTDDKYRICCGGEEIDHIREDGCIVFDTAKGRKYVLEVRG
ncbi:MAG: glycoside hydrolase family 95 protein [Ruminococcus sp.]|nr:glycoside hydrolase family 95 protein [Ruminococcus sp.]MBR1753014.1 glycoside hydrolase family 95 protein [Ruminococcus sp.]